MPIWEEKEETDKGHWNQADKIQDPVAKSVNIQIRNQKPIFPEWRLIVQPANTQLSLTIHHFKPLIQDWIFFKNTYSVPDRSRSTVENMD